MERMRQALRALFRRALSESGENPPGLVDILVDGARGRMEPRLGAQFDNGQVTWAELRAADCREFCTETNAWDMRSLRRELLREAGGIYERMRADHLFERFRRRGRGDHESSDALGDACGALLDRLRREAEALDRVGEWRRLQQEAAQEAAHRQLRRRGFLNWITGTMPFLRGPAPEGGSRRAQERGIALLKENLTPEQRIQFDKHGYFDVVGGKTGKRYRIRHGRSMNIEQLDKNGRRVCGWCFFPQGNLVAGDVMLAQKVALELYEQDALKIANRF